MVAGIVFALVLLFAYDGAFATSDSTQLWIDSNTVKMKWVKAKVEEAPHKLPPRYESETPIVEVPLQVQWWAEIQIKVHNDDPDTQMFLIFVCLRDVNNAVLQSEMCGAPVTLREIRTYGWVDKYPFSLAPHKNRNIKLNFLVPDSYKKQFAEFSYTIVPLVKVEPE